MKSYKTHPFLSIKGRLLVFTLCISLIPIIAITTIYYLNARSSLKHQILNQLKVVAESKRLHIRSLMEVNEVRVKNFSTDGYIRNKFEIIVREKTLRQSTVARLNKYLLKNKKPLYRHLIA